jgi:alpha-N-arabinofuranosidase
MEHTGTPPAIEITAEPLYDAAISPLIYGDFVEFINDLITGMRSEKVQDRSFEGVAQPVHVWPPGERWDVPRWAPWVAGRPHFAGWPDAPARVEMVRATARLTPDADRPFVGTRSARVTVEEEDGTAPYLAGISQGGIAVQAGQRLTVELYARADGAGQRPLTVLLGKHYGAYFRAYASLDLEGITDDWQKVGGTLISPVSDDDAVLAIGQSRPGTFWLDKVSLLPAGEDDLRGWRRDVVEAVRAMKPGIIRFGGSSLIYYQWETGIGPRERRAPFINQPWGNREEHDVGLHEFLEFCELVEAEPLICVNANSTTVEQILHEIDYCNGPATSEFGPVRAAMGHPAPFNVRYWQIGNEQEGEDYERVLAEYARAIRAAYPDLVLLASYPSHSILTHLSRDLDYLCPHYYAPYTPEGEGDLRRLIASIRQEAQNRDLKIGVTEWNHTGGHWGWARSWLQTLFNALNAARMFNMYQRLGDVIRIANRSNMTNSMFSGVIQTNRSELYLTPTYYVQAAYANLAGERPLAVRAAADEVLDLAATRRDAGGEIALFAVNYLGEPQTRRLHLSGLDAPQRASATSPLRVWTLAGPSLDAVNSFAEKTRLAPRESEQHAQDPDGLTYTFPPFSLTILRWSLPSTAGGDRA